MTPPYRLHYAPDNASLIIRLALEELDAPYETVLVDRSIRAQKSPNFLQLNPNGLIPVLETTEGPIFETAAILLWLADRHGSLGPGLNDPTRATFLKWLFFLSNTVHPAMRMRFYPWIYVGEDRAAQMALREVVSKEIFSNMFLLDHVSRTECETLIAADNPSVLDLYIACILRWIRLYPMDGSDYDRFDLQNWPCLWDMAELLEQRPSVKVAIRAEGLGIHPFTLPAYPDPPEGSAL